MTCMICGNDLGLEYCTPQQLRELEKWQESICDAECLARSWEAQADLLSKHERALRYLVELHNAEPLCSTRLERIPLGCLVDGTRLVLKSLMLDLGRENEWHAQDTQGIDYSNLEEF